MRLLIKSLRDFSRLYPLLHELIGSDVTKTKTVMATFMALSMAYNRGQEFDKSVLEQERSWDYAVWRANGASGEEPMKKPIDVLRETYAQLTAVRLDGLVISRDLAVAVISKGVFDASFVKSELEKSPYISRLTGDLWRILWSWRRSDASDASDVELALDGVLQSLLDFKIGNPIVLIHVFCILKDMEDAGVCLKLPKNVDESFSDYILSALERKILPTDVPKHQFRYSLSRMNDTGLGFCGEGSDFYERVITGLDDVLDQAFWIQIKEDPNHFVHELRSNALRLMWSLDDRGERGDAPNYAHIPVMGFTDVNRFADALVEMNAGLARTFAEICSDRLKRLDGIDHEMRGSEWPDERKWFRQLTDELSIRLTSEMSSVACVQLADLVDYMRQLEKRT